jgi:hypothetical protein
MAVGFKFLISKVGKRNTRFGFILIFLFFLLAAPGATVVAQQDSAKVKQDSVKQTDFMDVLKSIFKKNDTIPKPPKKKNIALLPGLGYNPSFGFLVGITIAGGMQLGNKENTTYSAFNLAGSITTKGNITLRARHNISAPGNLWNFQGDWQITNMGVEDYGLGIPITKTRGFAFNELSTKEVDSSFPIRYTYVKLFEKVYRSIGKYLYAGGGISFDMMFSIDDKKLSTIPNTPHQKYSLEHGFDTTKYSANGFIIGFLYNSRDHPNRPYKGLYADITFRFNQTWLGSKQNSTLAMYDIRKYWSLSRKNPEHVIALWHWATYTLGGALPYLQLPGTAGDMYQRSGRGYTFGRFKGPSFAAFELEWRFPVTSNKLISGVIYCNMQTAADDHNTKVFERWAPAAGIGVRILFNKYSRTNLSLDFARGRYGSLGLFSGLNEVF